MSKMEYNFDDDLYRKFKLKKELYNQINKPFFKEKVKKDMMNSIINKSTFKFDEVKEFIKNTTDTNRLYELLELIGDDVTQSYLRQKKIKNLKDKI